MAGYWDKSSSSSSSWSVKLGLFLSVAIAIAMIAMGVIYQKKCPAEYFIHIYMIVMGPCIIISSGLRWFSNKNNGIFFIDVIWGIVSVFTLAWFIAGNVWIYRLYGHYNPTDTEAHNYCHDTFYKFAFWMTTVNYILFGLGVLIACCTHCRK